MKNKSYLNLLNLQFANAQKSGINFFLQKLYGEIQNEFPASGKILEIGAGVGVSGIFIDREIKRTEYLEVNIFGIQDCVRAEALPFKNGEFALTFASDALHHFATPYQGVREMLRVTQSQGKVVFLEPYVSLFSLIIYKLFHDEQTTIFSPFNSYINQTEKEVFQGNQSVAQKIFFSRKGREYLGKEFPNIKINRKFLYPISFFATGGINKPFKISDKFIKKLIRFEELIPDLFMKFLASRQLIVISKLSN